MPPALKILRITACFLLGLVAGPAFCQAPTPPDDAAREQVLAAVDAVRPWLQTLATAAGPVPERRVRRAIGDIYTTAPDSTRAIAHWQIAARAGLQSGDPRLWANALAQLSNLGYRTGNLELAMDAEVRARDAARRFGISREELQATLDMGTLATVMNDLDGAENYFRTALAGFQAVGNRLGEARALRGLGRLMDTRGRYASAVTLQVDALAKMQGVGSTMDISESYFSIGRLLINLEDYAGAEASIGKAIELLPDTPSFFPRGLNLMNRALVLRLQDKPEPALTDIDAALAIMQSNGSLPGQAMAHTERGQVLALLGRDDEGVADSEAAVEMSRQVGDLPMIGDALLPLASVYNRLGRHDEALALAEEALAIGEQTDSDRYRADGAQEKEKALEGLGRPAEALAWSRRSREARERLSGVGRLGRLAEDGSPADLAKARETLLLLASAPVQAPVESAPARPAADPPAVPTAWMAGLAVIALVLAWVLLRTIRRLRHTHREKELISSRQRELESAHTDLKTQSERLRQQVTLDPLTGCLTRSAFAGELATLLAHADSHGRSVALLVFDLDNFKTINDQHGHLAGDVALHLVTGIARGKLRSDDLLGRFGGDEFLVACEGLDVASAEALAEAIRFDVVWRATEHQPPMPGLSISVGVAVCDQTRGYDPEQLFRRADTALYRAKRSGRNQVQLDLPGQAIETDSRRARQWGDALVD